MTTEEVKLIDKLFETAKSSEITMRLSAMHRTTASAFMEENDLEERESEKHASEVLELAAIRLQEIGM
jgi:hypothetical protein